ncbi:MAG: ComEC/Rec2 family competence protein [Phycisphaeraceae bacterium]
MPPARPDDPGVPGDVVPYAQSWRIARPYVACALATIVGLTLGRAIPSAPLWLAIAAAFILAALVTGSRRRRAATAGRLTLLAVVALAGAYHVLSVEHVRHDHIAHYVTDERQLAEVTGTVRSELSHPPRDEAGLARFSYRPDATLFEIDVDTVTLAGQPRPASGALSVRINQHEHRLTQGQRIRAAGWLQPVARPGNPGSFDYRAHLADRGIPGQLIVPTIRHWHDLSATPATASGATGGLPTSALRDARYALRQSMLDALRAGMPPGERVELLEALILGERGDSFRNTYDHFRVTGLAHLMAISGAHLAILLGLVWTAARFTGLPPRACAIIVLLVLLIYAFALPGRVPILRASMMAAAFCIAWATGRAMPAIALLAIAAIGVLLWRPADVASPGFQLSFAIVAMLILFTRRVSYALWPRHPHEELPPLPWRAWLPRRAADVTAVSLVAGVTALPLVACHFELVNPYAIVFSIASVVPFVLLLAVGYLKMAIGLIVPPLGASLAPLADGAAGASLWLVEAAAAWPGAGIELARPASPLWAGAAVAFAGALFAGRFHRRRAALAASLVTLAAWGLVHDRPNLLASATRARPVLLLRTFAVGHGAAHLISSGDRHILWDAGSHSFPEAGQRTIVPGLRRLGVTRLEAIYLTHADIDHYNGVPAIVAALRVDRVVVPPHFTRLADAEPVGPVAMLLDILDAADVPVEHAVRGHRTTLGDARIELLWPPARDPPPGRNDAGLVARVRAGDRTLLMTGDIQRDGIDRLLADHPDLAAEVMTLPHHGEHTPRTVALLARVQPMVVVQSSSVGQFNRDAWADALDTMPRAPDRLVTPRDGKATITIERDGRVHWSTFRRR